MTVSDNGMGFVTIAAAEKNLQSLQGAALIDALAKRLRGDLKRSNDNGAVTTLTFPASA